jgi:solute carrier family 25 phosphate transporter 23/24/25/41
VVTFAGLGPSITSIIPEAAITYGAFDILKKAYKRVLKVEEVPVLPALACGVSSAFMGQLVAYPLELVSRRLQVGAAFLCKQLKRL